MINKTADSSKTEIIQVIDNYLGAIESGDAALWESLFWLDDPDFSVLENDKPGLLGREYIDFITGLIRKRGKQPPLSRWDKNDVHLISDDAAYSTSFGVETFPDGKTKTTRITLVFRRKSEEWRIIHGHFSVEPK